MNTETSLQEILFDQKRSDCVARPLTRMVLSVLRDYTGASSNSQLGAMMGIKSPEVAISQMKNEKYKVYLHAEKLNNLALIKKITYEELMGIIRKKMFVVSDKDKRQAFLSGLQAASGLTVGQMFHQRLNGQEANFLQTGAVPLEWLKLVSDPQERMRIITDHCAKLDSATAVAKSRKRGGRKAKNKSTKGGVNDMGVSSSDLKSESELADKAVKPAPEDEAPEGKGRLFESIREMQMLSAISLAAQNAGEAKRFKLGICPEAFIGTLILQMIERNYTVAVSNIKQKTIKEDDATGKAFGKGNGHTISLVFQDDKGGKFSWKVDPGQFLTNKLV